MPISKIYARMAVLFLLGLALGWAGATVTLNLEKEKVAATTPDASADEPSAIRTYRNDTLGYTFQYPADWTVVDFDAGGSEGGMTVQLRSPESNQAFAEGKLIPPYSFDVVVSHWEDINDSFGTNPNRFRRFRDLDDYMTSGIDPEMLALGRVGVAGVDGYEASYGGFGTNYAVLFETDSVYVLSFTTAATKDQLTPGQRLVLESFALTE